MTLGSGSPVPWQKLVEPVDGVIVDPGEHVGEPCLRIDVIELGCLNERQHDRRAPAIGAGEQRSAALLVRQMRPSSRKHVKTAMRLSM